MNFHDDVLADVFNDSEMGASKQRCCRRDLSKYDDMGDLREGDKSWGTAMVETAMGTEVETDSIEGFLMKSRYGEVWSRRRSLKIHNKMTSFPKLLISDYIL
jgi:hypothetical protein